MPERVTDEAEVLVPLATGLGNRLWSISCLATLAECTGHRPAPVWMQTADFGGRFGDLFEPLSTGVLPFTIADGGALPRRPATMRSPENLLREHLSALAGKDVNHWKLLMAPVIDPGLAPFRSRCIELFSVFRPSPPLVARIERFRRDHFRPTMIGVHLRRGDFIRVHPRSAANEPEVIRHIDAFLAADPGAGILLVTDDGAIDPITREAARGGVRERFLTRYGDRLVIPPCHSVDRATAAAAEDAVVDLWLLRQVDRFVGTRWSTFSAMAFLGRGIPTMLCVGEAGVPPASGAGGMPS